MSIDYRELLYTYMGCVRDYEGTTFVREFERLPDFSEEEYEALMEVHSLVEEEYWK